MFTIQTLSILKIKSAAMIASFMAGISLAIHTITDQFTTSFNVSLISAAKASPVEQSIGEQQLASHIPLLVEVGTGIILLFAGMRLTISIYQAFLKEVESKVKIGIKEHTLEEVGYRAALKDIMSHETTEIKKETSEIKQELARQSEKIAALKDREDAR